MARASVSARSVLWKIHRWIGVGLCVLLVPIALSGAALVIDDELDALIHPARYATTGTATLPLSAYLASAAQALQGAQASSVRFPEAARSPIIVQARQTGEDGRPRILNVYVDPPTGRVLEVVDFRSSLFGFLHVFHENLTIPEYSGRAIVGWAGVGMLILSLSGIVLWWPRNGEFIPGLRWRRAPQTSSNLHHLAGFWISVPLAFVSLTGIYLSFPPQARSLMSSVAPMTPQGPRFGAPARQTSMNADSALAAALKAEPATQPAMIFVPVAARGEGAPAPSWRMQLRTGADETVTLLVNDRNGEVARAPAPLSGDRAAQWIRWLHEGSHSGGIWRAIVFVTGILPAVFSITGVMMWLRGRRNRKAVLQQRKAAGSLQAAE